MGGGARTHKHTPEERGAVQGQAVIIYLPPTVCICRNTHPHITHIRLKAIPPACCCLTLCVAAGREVEIRGERRRGLILLNLPALISKMIILRSNDRCNILTYVSYFGVALVASGISDLERNPAAAFIVSCKWIRLSA